MSFFLGLLWIRSESRTLARLSRNSVKMSSGQVRRVPDHSTAAAMVGRTDARERLSALANWQISCGISSRESRARFGRLKDKELLQKIKLQFSGVFCLRRGLFGGRCHCRLATGRFR
jgi:hypothetical protein